MSDRVEGDVPEEERLPEAVVAALLGAPAWAGLRLVEAAVPEGLEFLDRAAGAALSRAAGPAVAPGVMPPPGPVAGAAMGEVARDAPGLPVAAPMPELPVSRFARAEREETVWHAAERAAVAGLPLAAPPPRPAARASVPEAAPARIDPRRLDWEGLDWPGVVAVPGVPPAAPLPVALALPMALAPVEAVPSGAAPVNEAWSGIGTSAGPSAAPLPPLAVAPEAADPAWSAAAPASASPEPEEAEARTIEGRLEVDGALLGRFVAEHLAREAGRPPSGMTGFDPLVSPEWAGALQG